MTTSPHQDLGLAKATRLPAARTAAQRDTVQIPSNPFWVGGTCARLAGLVRLLPLRAPCWKSGAELDGTAAIARLSLEPPPEPAIAPAEGRLTSCPVRKASSCAQSV